MRYRRRAGASIAVAAIVLSGCGPDGPDAYTALPDDAPAAGAVVRTLPSTTVPAPGAPPPVSYPANGETVEVRALDNTFRPETLEVVAGTEVLWINGGRNDHDVLPVDDGQAWGVATDGFLPGDEYRLVFDTPGVFPYFCSIHGTKEVGMVGTVVVSPPGS